MESTDHPVLPLFSERKEKGLFNRETTVRRQEQTMPEGEINIVNIDFASSYRALLPAPPPRESDINIAISHCIFAPSHRGLAISFTSSYRNSVLHSEQVETAKQLFYV